MRITFYLESDAGVWYLDSEQNEFKKEFTDYYKAVAFCKDELPAAANVQNYEVYDIDNAGRAVFEEDGELWVTSQYGGEDTKYMKDVWIDGGEG